MVGQAGVTVPLSKQACGTPTCLFLQLISETSEPRDIASSSRTEALFMGWGMKYSERFRAVQCLPQSTLMGISGDRHPQEGWETLVVQHQTGTL